MGHCFSHLQLTDRRKIEYGLNRGDTPKQIAAELHVHVSTIYREIKRARWEHLDGDTWIMEDRYNPDGAEKRYRENLAAKISALSVFLQRTGASFEGIAISRDLKFTSISVITASMSSAA